MTEVVLTADRPTGPLHLGHYIGSLKNRVNLQKQFSCYIMVADTQALSDNFDNPKKVTDNTVEVCKDYVSVGITPSNGSTIFIQSLIPELSELTMYYMNIVTLGRLERNPTVKAELQMRGFEESVPVGFLCYPVSQAADITAFKATMIPVGEDQLPLIELSNEIVRKFNRLYKTDTLKESKAILGRVQRLVGIDGKAKASKSLNNAIFLCDSKENVREKIYSMYTDPGHIKVSDPGIVEGNVVFTYLDAFYDNQDELCSLKDHYRKGGLGDTTLKELLDKTLQTLLEPIREKRQSVSNAEVIDIMFDGSRSARKVAMQTLQEVKEAIGIRYQID